MSQGRGDLPLDQVIGADCLSAMRAWADASIDLVYMDPPFNTGRTLRGSSSETAFEDRWEGVEGYLAFLRPRIEQAARLLRPTGSVLVHCDWRTSHHVRLLLDEVFGAERFVNHLIWRYGLGGSSPRRFARKHDDILFYSRTERYHFDAPMVPATSERMRGQLKKATDVLDIPAINNMAVERVGYPTQKPLALLKVLISACSPQGGVVLDPFCGSGTTLVAAQVRGRKWIGIDVNPKACAIARDRLASGAAVQRKEPAMDAGS